MAAKTKAGGSYWSKKKMCFMFIEAESHCQGERSNKEELFNTVGQRHFCPGGCLLSLYIVAFPRNTVYNKWMLRLLVIYALRYLISLNGFLHYIRCHHQCCNCNSLHSVLAFLLDIASPGSLLFLWSSTSFSVLCSLLTACCE